jgi:hypothetical protein
MKSLSMVKYRKPTRPTTLQPVLLREPNDKKYQLADLMGALLKIPGPRQHQCRTCLANPDGDALGPGTLLSPEVVERLPHHLHRLGGRDRLCRLSSLRRLELADLLLQCLHFPLQMLPSLLCLELKLV